MSDSSQALPIETRGELDAVVVVPGSKSITNRALLMAALAQGESRLHGALDSDDTIVMRDCVEQLGARVDAGGDPWRVHGVGGRLSLPEDPLYVQNSGTTARFITAAACLAPGDILIDGNRRMRERPIADLVEALRGLGARVTVEGENECPPVRTHGHGLPGGEAEIDASHSSQYVSAILLAAPYAKHDVELRFKGGVIVSRPYIDLTLDCMQAFGAEAGWRDEEGDERLWVRAGRPYEGRDYAIEPDASSAAYPLSAAAIAGGRVRVEGIPERSHQSDFQLLALLARMGCQVERRGGGVEVTGPSERLKSLGSVDMNALPDAVLAYAVVCLFADGPTTITNVANLRIKETDRLAALETELRKLGARAEAGPDWLRVQPGPLHGAEIDTYDDHRMAMSFALAGLRVPGVVIRDPGCVSKTWPKFFELFERL